MVCFVKLAVLSPPRKLHFRQLTHRLSAKSSGTLKLVEARSALVTGLILLLLCCQLQQTMVSALSCEPCDVATCVNDTNCPGGMVLGPCRCCYECARQVNQSCGGIYDLSGTCDKNLHCVRPLSEDVTSEESLVGICMGK
ncbi:cysteine-rich motor neuron 1 protein [Biomphalaria pfeifferi]|uniref:Cysteine-rich motor neuron 1 protein n=1 Tax=Biomphalaria pfeifferi TaxID=112525 RepID=A0AAD8ANX6_BIOPF|nr:cysteine-rich motor neuron 1 protein [Biomphalaria pfeifferi]